MNPSSLDSISAQSPYASDSCRRSVGGWGGITVTQCCHRCVSDATSSSRDLLWHNQRRCSDLKMEPRCRTFTNSLFCFSLWRLHSSALTLAFFPLLPLFWSFDIVCTIDVQLANVLICTYVLNKNCFPPLWCAIYEIKQYENMDKTAVTRALELFYLNHFHYCIIVLLTSHRTTAYFSLCLLLAFIFFDVIVVA